MPQSKAYVQNAVNSQLRGVKISSEAKPRDKMALWLICKFIFEERVSTFLFYFIFYFCKTRHGLDKRCELKKKKRLQIFHLSIIHIRNAKPYC